MQICVQLSGTFVVTQYRNRMYIVLGNDFGCMCVVCVYPYPGRTLGAGRDVRLRPEERLQQRHEGEQLATAAAVRQRRRRQRMRRYHGGPECSTAMRLTRSRLAGQLYGQVFWLGGGSIERCGGHVFRCRRVLANAGVFVRTHAAVCAQTWQTNAMLRSAANEVGER